MIVTIDWRIALGCCLLIILVSWFFSGGDIQEYIGMKPLHPGVKVEETDELKRLEKMLENEREFIDKNADYFNREKNENKERRRERNAEKRREERWKRENLYQRPVYEDIINEKRRPHKERANNVDGLHINTEEPKPKKEITVIPWGAADKSRGERLCAQILSNLLGLEFLTVRIPEIKNPETGQPLEIDCYNVETKIGLEYQGPQHYHHPNWTGNSFDDFRKQIARDEFKRTRCHELGIRLIEVPYNVKEIELQDYILDKLQEVGVKITND